MVGNEDCYERSFLTSLWAKVKEICFAQDFKSQFLERGIERNDVWVGWKHPPPGWRKINLDEIANIKKGVATTGGLVRD